ncbi:MAG: hypothetical protein LIP04_15385 [Tannerellaceae bacterium]|nr:hypothetical protein [Tannerellaceae bacterium]
MKRYALPFTRLLLRKEQFCIESGDTYYRLHCGISEFYILQNLTGEAKKDGSMIVSIEEQKGKPVLCPVAILQNGQILWITVTEDEQTDDLPLPDRSLLTPFETEAGEAYPDGFIDATRTAISYKELMDVEKYLHETDYVTDLWYVWQKKYPDSPYDVRFHYWMIKNIRKHRHYTDDFKLPCHPHTFYHGWNDPFPWYLYIKTFGRVDTWPSFARMRLMAENSCRQAIPLAIKVLKNDKANDRIRHYALLVAGLQEANDELVSSYAEKYPRAVARIWCERQSSNLYPMILENAHCILAGETDDILDDLPETYMNDHNKYEEYTINHRGYITLEVLTLEQVREVWSVYREIAKALTKSREEKECLRLGNAFRSFMLAVVYNKTQAVSEIMWEVYSEYNYLLYTKWSQDSHFRAMDIMWSDYLYRYVVSLNILDNFWQWIQSYAKNYDSYYIYTNQRFFLMIYSKIAYHILPPETFYDALAPLIDSDYVLVEDIWAGVTDDRSLEENDTYPPLGHRWENMFLHYNYYAWTGKAHWYYQLVRHRIQPHPANWSIEAWQKDLTKKRKQGSSYPGNIPQFPAQAGTA